MRFWVYTMLAAVLVSTTQKDYRVGCKLRRWRVEICNQGGYISPEGQERISDRASTAIGAVSDLELAYVGVAENIYFNSRLRHFLFEQLYNRVAVRSGPGSQSNPDQRSLQPELRERQIGQGIAQAKVPYLTAASGNNSTVP